MEASTKEKCYIKRKIEIQNFAVYFFMLQLYLSDIQMNITHTQNSKRYLYVTYQTCSHIVFRPTQTRRQKCKCERSAFFRSKFS